MRIVLDTNVLISALAFSGSKPDQILRHIRKGWLDLFISPFILSELDRVLREKFRFGKKEADARVRAIRSIAHLDLLSESTSSQPRMMTTESSNVLSLLKPTSS